MSVTNFVPLGKTFKEKNLSNVAFMFFNKLFYWIIERGRVNGQKVTGKSNNKKVIVKK